MIKNKKVCALITARGGSKGILDKNIQLVAGKPLLVWSIEAARKSRFVERVIVSTDAPEIRAIAVKHGAEAPFLRPAELARDETPGVAPVLHAVRWLEEHEGYRPQYVLLLQPTSPLRSAEDIDAALRLLESHNAPAVESVYPVSDHPYLVKSIAANGELKPFMPGKEDSRHQELPPLYAENGAVFMIRREMLLAKQTFWPPGTIAYIMPAERSLDINTPWDLHLADLILRDARGKRAN